MNLKTKRMTTTLLSLFLTVHGTWTQEEDDELKYMKIELKSPWKDIATAVEHSVKQCKKRWKQLCGPTPVEEERTGHHFILTSNFLLQEFDMTERELDEQLELTPEKIADWTSDHFMTKVINALEFKIHWIEKTVFDTVNRDIHIYVMCAQLSVATKVWQQRMGVHEKTHGFSPTECFCCFSIKACIKIPCVGRHEICFSCIQSWRKRREPDAFTCPFCRGACDTEDLEKLEQQWKTGDALQIWWERDAHTHTTVQTICTQGFFNETRNE